MEAYINSYKIILEYLTGQINLNTACQGLQLNGFSKKNCLKVLQGSRRNNVISINFKKNKRKGV